jgi:hypothetical protein
LPFKKEGLKENPALPKSPELKRPAHRDRTNINPLDCKFGLTYFFTALLIKRNINKAFPPTSQIIATIGINISNRLILYPINKKIFNIKGHLLGGLNL